MSLIVVIENLTINSLIRFTMIPKLALLMFQEVDHRFRKSHLGQSIAQSSNKDDVAERSKAPA